MNIKKIKAFKMDLVLREKFAISFETFTRVQNVLVVLNTDEGIAGYSESCPYKMITGDTQNEALLFLSHAAKELEGQSIDMEQIHQKLNAMERKIGFSSNTGRAAIDMACYDVVGKKEGKPIYKLLGASKPNIVPTTLTIGIKSPEETVKTVESYMELFKRNRLKRIKLKLSGNAYEDITRVTKVANVFHGELTLDANQGYKDPKTALKVFNELYEVIGPRILLIEEPCPKGKLEMMKYINENSPIPIYADESVATIEDAKKLIEKGSASGINIKLQKAGGIYQATKIAEMAVKNDLKLMVGCMLETYLSLSGSINFVAGTPIVTSADLDSDLLEFSVNIVREDPRDSFIDGARVPTDKPGLGVEITDWLKAMTDGHFTLEMVI